VLTGVGPVLLNRWRLFWLRQCSKVAERNETTVPPPENLGFAINLSAFCVALDGFLFCIGIGSQSNRHGLLTRGCNTVQQLQ